MGCVYSATCIANGKQYVGKTKGELAIRQTQHHSAANTKRRSLFHKALSKYGNEAFRWDILFESDDEAVLYQKEREFIEKLGTFVPNGYNLTSGGDGNYNVQFDDEWKAKNQARADALGRKVYCVETDTIYISYAEANKATGVPTSNISGCCKSQKHLTYSRLHFCYATDDEIINLKRLKAEGQLEKKRSFSAEWAEKVRQRETGRKHSPEFCENQRQRMLMNNPFKGKTFTPEQRERMLRNQKGTQAGIKNPSARAVYCVELDRTFPYMKKAAEELGLKPAAASNISSCCSGKLTTAYGYHWQYADAM